LSFRLSKRVISNYLRSGCKRRLALDLVPDTIANRADREALGMPPRLVARPGLRIIQDQGDEWERLKIADVEEAFGRQALVCNRVVRDGEVHYEEVRLDDVLRRGLTNAEHFVIQGEFTPQEGGVFERAVGLDQLRAQYDLSYSDLRPDIIQRLALGTCATAVTPSGSLIAVLAGDQRIPLRVVDVKLTAEPSNAYYAEVVYYSMSLAGHLEDAGLDGVYFVAPNPAVWPGSHDASALATEREAQRRNGRNEYNSLIRALEVDVELAPFGVFAPRLRHFFSEELREAIETQWQDLPWHVGTRCSGCDYLGIQWRGGAAADPNHCYPTAQRIDHLSRMPFVSRGARAVLEGHEILSVADLAAAGSDHPSLRDHQTLRATRTVVASRADAITRNLVIDAPGLGTSALMPAWADIKLFLTADFDIGSGITGAFGLSGTSWDHQARRFTSIPTEVFVVDSRNVVTERRELLRFLQSIAGHLQAARDRKADASVQVYVWDQATYEHLVRVIGRHLPNIVALRQTQNLIWLFPPDEVVPNPDLADRKSPICLVQQVVKAVVAAPVDHYYSLLRLARQYHPATLPPNLATFEVNDLFEDPLTDQIPSERIHEIWAKEPRWTLTLQNLERTVRARQLALKEVTQRVEQDLRGTLTQSAPRIEHLKPPVNRQGLAEDSKLWLMFAEWDSAVAKLQNQQVLCMPEHEREARFRSALLVGRLHGRDRADALDALGLPVGSGEWVYELAEDSADFRGREGDFLFCLRSQAWASSKLRDFANQAGLDENALGLRTTDLYLPMDTVLQVAITRLDRDLRLVVIEPSAKFLPAINLLEAAGVIDLSGPLMLDPTYRDFLLDKLRDVLSGVGNPPEAAPAPEIQAAIPSTRRASRRTTSTIQSQLFWTPSVLYDDRCAFDVDRARATLEGLGTELNESQWDALRAALTRRLCLIWGPPGTGKSKTLRAIIEAIGLESAGRSVKVLVTGPTYEALQNIVGANSFLDAGYSFVGRVASAHRPLQTLPGVRDLVLASRDDRQETIQLISDHNGPLVVSATSQQAYNLVKASGLTLRPVFDYVIVDEASQMDVATSMLAFTGLQENGSVVIAGDPLQLPPIHQAVPDESYDYLVSSIYEYLRTRFAVPEQLLRVNYRSNQEIVSVGYSAGYSRQFMANMPGKRLAQVSTAPMDDTPPAGWPAAVPWSSAYSVLLSPSRPVSCFVYPEGRSCQSNEFEAFAVTQLVTLARLTVRSDGGDELCTDTEFWTKKLGIVTPHRAQQALITRRLQQAFPTSDPSIIRSAVDTVERFQGQEREIIIGSYAVGDEDAIGQEETFLMSLNRFNVMASRARTKLLTILTRELVDHLASDPIALRESAMLKSFVENVCSQAERLDVPSATGAAISGWHRYVPV